MTKDNATLFGSFKHHFSQREANASIVFLESLRELYPDRLITVNSNITDPLPFAQAGFAKAERVGQGSNDMSNYLYVAETNRLHGGQGRIDEYVEFGQYDYTYKGVQSTIYVVEWQSADGNTQRRYYYLAPEQDPQSPAWANSILKAAGKYNSELHEEIYVYDNGCWRKDKSLFKAVQAASWDDVILDPAMKDTLIKDVQGFFDSRAVYEEYAVPWKRGIIIHGTPGCGKTISIKALMKAIASQGAMSLYVKSFSSNRGSNQAIRAIFSYARKMAPCMLIFEDLDSLVVDEVRSYFLNEVDGLESNHGILMVGSTNHLDRLDPGISKRPSRFDRKYHYDLPGTTERMLYCDYWRAKLKHNHDIDLSRELCGFVTDLTDGFSFAYLKELFVQTLLAIVGGRADEPEDVDSRLADVADNTVIDEHSSSLLRVGGSTDNTEAASGGSAGDTAARDSKRRQHALETEIIPEQLLPNPLARVFCRQIRALRKDMDNTANAEDESAKEGDEKAKGEKTA